MVTGEEASRLRPGNFVMATKSSGGGFIEGEIYTIGGHYYMEGECSVSVVKDSRGRPNGWGPENFVLLGGPW